MYRIVQFSILILILALVGCQTTGIHKADRTVRIMNKKFAKLKGAPDEITAVTTSLNALVKEGGDMRAEFKAFDKDVNNLIYLQDRFRKLKTDLNSSKSDLIGTWAESQFTINNDELRARSRERRSEVIARFNEVNELVTETKAVFDPWLQEVIDIRTYLESDLNPDGVASIADMAPKVSKKAKPVRSKIANLITELDKLSNEMTATWPSESRD